MVHIITRLNIGNFTLFLAFVKVLLILPTFVILCFSQTPDIVVLNTIILNVSTASIFSLVYPFMGLGHSNKYIRYVTFISGMGICLELNNTSSRFIHLPERDKNFVFKYTVWNSLFCKYTLKQDLWYVCFHNILPLFVYMSFTYNNEEYFNLIHWAFFRAQMLVTILVIFISNRITLTKYKKSMLATSVI